MAKELQYSITTVNEQTVLMSNLLGGGRLLIFTAPKPDSPDVQPGEAQLLVEFEFDTPAFGEAVKGVATAKPIDGAYAQVSGKAAWYRAVRADGYSLFDGT